MWVFGILTPYHTLKHLGDRGAEISLQKKPKPRRLLCWWFQSHVKLFWSFRKRSMKINSTIFNFFLSKDAYLCSVHWCCKPTDRKCWILRPHLFRIPQLVVQRNKKLFLTLLRCYESIWFSHKQLDGVRKAIYETDFCDFLKRSTFFVNAAALQQKRLNFCMIWSMLEEE